ncbi:MAG: DNA polymerase III subunit delta, partial [Persicimonas sp.]
DLAELDQALSKIDLFVGDMDKSPRPVDDELVREVVAHTKVHTVFDLTDELGERDFEGAARILDNMLLHGESPIGILAMIARHFRILSRLHDPSVRTLGRNEKARAVGVVPFFLKDYQRHASKFSLTEIESLRERFLETDSALKSSGLDDRTVLERLLFDICFRGDADGAKPRV